MSLGIVVKGPEGLVLAADSRVTLTATQSGGQQLHVNYDNATKLLAFNHPNNSVGVVTYGQAAIGQDARTVSSFAPEFEASLPDEQLTVEEFAKQLSDFFVDQWQSAMPSNYQGPDISFVVGGFNRGEPYGRVFDFKIPSDPTPGEKHSNPGEFGITWGGQGEAVERLLKGYDPRLPQTLSQVLNLTQDQMKRLEPVWPSFQAAIPIGVLPLQDCVDLAIFFIRTTISMQQLTVGLRGVGGPIDVATITRSDGLKFVQRKQIQGE